MFQKLLLLVAALLLCSSCVSRTTTLEPGLKGDTSNGKINTETKIIWFWDKDF